VQKKTTKDLYKLLGLPREASQDEIGQAHRKLVRKYHPDANPEDPRAEEHFKEIQQAYEILSNEEHRREYDKGLQTSSRGNSARPHSRAGGRTGEGGITVTSSERVSRDRGPLFWLGYLLAIALVALVITLLVMLVLGLG
jgi:curved DNA-binding protein CbpA